MLSVLSFMQFVLLFACTSLSHASGSQTPNNTAPQSTPSTQIPAIKIEKIEPIEWLQTEEAKRAETQKNIQTTLIQIQKNSPPKPSETAHPITAEPSKPVNKAVTPQSEQTQKAESNTIVETIQATETAEKKPTEAKKTEPKQPDTSITTRIEAPFFGDLTALRDRRVIRVLVSVSRTNFFQTTKGFRGIEHDLLKAYEKYLNEGKRKQRYQTEIVFIPTTFEDTLTKLQEGYGDIAAAGLSITPERSHLVSFTDPYIKDVTEVLVTHPSAPEIATLEDLSGKQVIVVRNSSHIIHLTKLNVKLGQLGLSGIEVVQAHPLLESEDLLNMVNQGLYDYTIADSHLAEIWSEVMPNLLIEDAIQVHDDVQIAWATQKNTPELQASLNQFIRRHAKQGRKLGNILFRKYFENSYWIERPLTNDLLASKKCVKAYLQIYSTFYDFDWRLIAAQAYQESHFDQTKKSPVGALGIMQVKPSTAGDKHIQIKNIQSLENNIHAGIRYLAFLKERYFSSDDYSVEDQMNFALAAYNAGPAKVRRMQKEAKEKGLNPNIWFKHVETIARQRIGRETVNYVSQIQKMRLFLMASENISQQKQQYLQAQQDEIEYRQSQTIAESTLQDTRQEEPTTGPEQPASAVKTSQPDS